MIPVSSALICINDPINMTEMLKSFPQFLIKNMVYNING